MVASRPIISVLMPAFNAEKYIGQAIQSVLDQTFEKFELIIYDDGSTDRTREIIEEFSDLRIKKIFSDSNKRLVASRNALVKAAKGRYIAFLDSDDIAYPDRLRVQYNFLESNWNVDICGADHYTLNADTGKLKASKQLHSDVDIRALLTVSCPVCNPSVMARAEIFKSFPYDSSAILAEDYGLWTELALAGYRFSNLNQRLITYRIHANQVSQLGNQSSEKIFHKFQLKYLSELGIPIDLCPRQMQWSARLNSGIQFLLMLNKKIKKISFLANYQIYARFQYRHNAIFTPFTRLERFVVALYATLVGRLIKD